MDTEFSKRIWTGKIEIAPGLYWTGAALTEADTILLIILNIWDGGNGESIGEMPVKVSRENFAQITIGKKILEYLDGVTDA